MIWDFSKLKQHGAKRASELYERFGAGTLKDPKTGTIVKDAKRARAIVMAAGRAADREHASAKRVRAAVRHPDRPGAGAERRRKLGLTGREKTSVVMREFYAGTLRSSSGDLVTDPAQAKAIAMSEGRAAEDRAKVHTSHKNPGARHMATTRPRKTLSEHDERQAEALYLFADNTGELYAQKKAIIAKLSDWMAAGKYDANRAPMLWLPWINAAAKLYAKEFEEDNQFSPAARRAAAADVAAHEAGRIQRGEYGAKPMAHAKKTHKPKVRAKRAAAPHERGYKPRAHKPKARHSPAHHSTAHLAGPAPHKKRTKHRAAAYRTVTDTHRVPVAPSAETAVKALYKAIDDVEKVETQLLTVRAALRLVRPNKTKPKHPKVAKHRGPARRGAVRLR